MMVVQFSSMHRQGYHDLEAAAADTQSPTSVVSRMPLQHYMDTKAKPHQMNYAKTVTCVNPGNRHCETITIDKTLNMLLDSF